MELNGINEGVAFEILKMLEEEKCTVKQACEILSFVQKYLLGSSTVQFDRNAFVKEFISR